MGPSCWCTQKRNRKFQSTIDRSECSILKAAIIFFQSPGPLGSVRFDSRRTSRWHRAIRATTGPSFFELLTWSDFSAPDSCLVCEACRGRGESSRRRCCHSLKRNSRTNTGSPGIFLWGTKSPVRMILLIFPRNHMDQGGRTFSNKKKKALQPVPVRRFNFPDLGGVRFEWRRTSR